MAQTLVEDRSYNLCTGEEDLDKKHVYFVKLTDSCLKAIEELISYKVYISHYFLNKYLIIIVDLTR